MLVIYTLIGTCLLLLFVAWKKNNDGCAGQSQNIQTAPEIVHMNTLIDDRAEDQGFIVAVERQTDL